MQKASGEQIEAEIASKTYVQSVKSKNKQNEVSAIKKDDFLQIIAKLAPPGITAETIEAIESAVWLNPKFPSIYKVKSIQTLLTEAGKQ